MASQTSALTCPHADACGACALLGTGYREQLANKRGLLDRAIRREAGLGEVTVSETLPSPLVEGYRNRAKLAVERTARTRTKVGYYRFGTRTLVDAPSCRVLVPEILETANVLRELLDGDALRSVPVRFLDVRCGTDPRRQHLTLVVEDEDARFALARVRDACPMVSGISINVNPGTGSQVIKGPVVHAWGERHVIVVANGVELRISPGSFFQVNLSLLAPIHERMRKHLSGARSLADLYAGVGTHGLALRGGFDRVLLIEGVNSSVRDARASAEAAGATNVAIFGAPVERALTRFEASASDAVVLNPSREGARPEVLQSIARSRARRVAYLSCNPQTLARDLAVLVEGGLRVSSVTPIDMMPQTLQVEALALLERAVTDRAMPRRESSGRRSPGPKGPRPTRSAR